MYKKSIVLLTGFAFIAALFLTSCGGGFKVKEGSLDFLKGQKKFKVIYDYSDMGVGKFEHEQDYLDKKVQEYNEKEPGKGDIWLKAWKSDRAIKFQPKFEELVNKYLNKVNVSIDPGYDDAQYTIILKTVYTEPGFNAYIMRKNAHINVYVIFVETKNPGNVLAKLEMDKIQGATFGGNDYDTGTRLSESYAKCGKELGKYLEKYFE